MVDPRDAAILADINRLAEEQDRLFASAADGGGLSPADRMRLDEIQLESEQCYDLLHQRRARRDAGLDPDEAEIRPAAMVAHYQQ